MIHLIAEILVFIIAIEHIGICLLEMFASSQKKADVFDLTLQFTRQKEAQVALANQGIYNGMLGVIIICAFFLFKGAILNQVWVLILSLIVIVGAYGGFTATKKIFLVQMLPAIIAIILLLI